MKTALALFFSLLLVASALASTDLLSPMAPAKVAEYHQPSPVDPVLVRQGGDTIDDAVVITVPYSGGGTTAGYTDDYDEACPYTGSTSPDVVYTFTATADQGVDIDLYGSLYDTQVYLYDEELNLVDCNDDFYSDYTSKLENVAVVAGTQYYVVIDGYGGYAGEYTLAITEFVPCVLDIPAGAELEGEPELEEGYNDCYNSGCGAEGETFFPDGMQPLLGDEQGMLVFHGRSGWYLCGSGSTSRDTDWFQATVGPSGSIEVTVDAQYALYLFELGPQDCNQVGVLQNVAGGPCEPNIMTVYGDPGSQVWLWTGPTTFDGPLGGYDYLLTIEGLQPGTVPTEGHSWSGMKSMFN